jgi:hypothetical protein
VAWAGHDAALHAPCLCPASAMRDGLSKLIRRRAGECADFEVEGCDVQGRLAEAESQDLASDRPVGHSCACVPSAPRKEGCRSESDSPAFCGGALLCGAGPHRRDRNFAVSGDPVVTRVRISVKKEGH